MFKKSLDEGIIKFEELKKLEKIKSLKFDMEDINEIKNNKIKFSEIAAEEMNFQNFKDICWLWESGLRVNKNFKTITSNKNKNFYFPKLIKKGSGVTFGKEMTKFIVRNFGAGFALPDDDTKFTRMAHLLKLSKLSESSDYTLISVDIELREEGVRDITSVIYFVSTYMENMLVNPTDLALDKSYLENAQRSMQTRFMYI
jgi:hypothetical protein